MRPCTAASCPPERESARNRGRFGQSPAKCLLFHGPEPDSGRNREDGIIGGIQQGIVPKDGAVSGPIPEPILTLVLIHRSDPEFLRRALRALHHLTASRHILIVCDLGPAAESEQVRYLAGFFPKAVVKRPPPGNAEPGNVGGLAGPFNTEFLGLLESTAVPVVFGWDNELFSAADRTAFGPAARVAAMPLPPSPPSVADRKGILARLDEALDRAILEAARLPDSPLEDVACGLCGGRETRTALRANDLFNRLPGFWTVAECRSCGLAYTNPRPRADGILAYYPESYVCYQPHAPEAPPAGGGLKGAIKRFRGRYRKQLMRQHFGYYAATVPASPLWKALTFPLRGEERMKLIAVMPAGRPNPKMLEIGCGVGTSLGVMKSMGWNVIGVEPSQAASEVARANGLDVRTADIAAVGFAPGEFDVVVMNMVLEHLPSPRQALERILGWLRPGGELLISVPDFSGFESRVFGAYHYGLQVPTHLFHFTPRTLRKMLPGMRLEIRHQHVHRDLKAGLEFLTEFDRRTPWRLLLRLPRGAFVAGAFALSLVGKTSRMSMRARKPL